MSPEQGSITIYSPDGAGSEAIQRKLAALGAHEFQFRSWIGTGISTGDIVDFAWFTRDSGHVSVERLARGIAEETDWFVAPSFCSTQYVLRWPSQATDVLLEPTFSQLDLERVLKEEGIDGAALPSYRDYFLVGPNTQSGFEVVAQARRLHERPEIRSAKVWWGGFGVGPTPMRQCPILGPQIPSQIPATTPLGLLALGAVLSAAGLFLLRT